ncbi:MAG TPA: hypothetical protein VM580_13540, partial [Labilithrix sp.]|nr:hypothetical protein [Labilithrix sp.]
KDDIVALSEEAKKHAQKVRDAVRPLPNVGGGSDSWTSKGAAAREHAEAEAKLGERARELAKKGRDQEALPPAALDALRGAEQAAHEAARALREGDADEGLRKQAEAQQKLEMARDALGDSDGDRESPSGEGDRNASRDHADIPKADAHKGPEEFRKRVIKGLGQPSSGKYKDAVKRYAEGLLR